MPTIDKINQEIAIWLHGSGKDLKIVRDGKNWRLVKKKKFGNTTVDKIITDKNECMFHTDYNHLMLCFKKVLDTEGNWYAIYEYIKGEWQGTGKNKKYVRKKTYSCAFTTQGFGRMGYGEKFNHDFLKESIIMAMHYSLYRFIKKGREY